MDTIAHRPPPPRHRLSWKMFLSIAVVAAVAGAGWWWLARQAPPVTEVAKLEPATAPATASTEIPTPRVAQAPEPEPSHTSEPLAAGEIVPSLQSLLGREAVLRLVQTTDLPRLIVATVDNLARESAPASAWPVNPAAGRFRVVEQPDGRLVADPDNMTRYAPLVLLAESADPAALAAWYGRALPLLQQAYEDLGYPRQRFHARLMAVLDHLLATPPAPQPLVLQLTEVRGPVPASRPWLRYEFADPALEQASAGRKILWRVGPVNQRRLMNVLAGFRDALRSAPR